MNKSTLIPGEKRFTLAGWNLTSPVIVVWNLFRFAGTNIYHVIVSALPSGIKKYFNACLYWRTKRSVNKSTLIPGEKRFTLAGWNLTSPVIVVWNLFQLDRLNQACDKNTRTRRETYLKLKIKTPERRQWGQSGVFLVNSEHILHFVLVFLFLILNM